MKIKNALVVFLFTTLCSSFLDSQSITLKSDIPIEEDSTIDNTILESTEGTQEDKVNLSENEAPVEDDEVPEESLGEILPEPQRKPLEIEGADNPLTIKYRDYYLTNEGRKWLAKSLADSVRYRPYVRQKLTEKNLPMLLQYLPIVESNYKATAVSSAGAVGVWQFMVNSMSPFLKRNSWYDERRDPWKSTDAALIKLKDNYNIFHDWAIAIAAYNCGTGAMNRIIKKYPEKDFWYLAEKGLLRTQSAQYVPKLIAIADIVENAEYYGAIEIGATDKMIEDIPVENFDYITVAGMFSLTQIAKVTGIEEDEITFLNPELIRSCTPARETYKLRLPLGTGSAAEEALKEQGVATDAITYVVKKGDSLWSISRKYNVKVQYLCEINNIEENDILSIGKTLIVPMFKE